MYADATACLTMTQLPWRPGFAQLGPTFYTRLAPQPLPRPYWVGRSPALAQELGLDPRWWDSPTALEAFTGNRLLPGSTPLASVYSGHQFGHWAGQLGDGRAILLGEIDSPNGPQEIQLKGAGRTPYSRSGDGRAVLRSSIREFLASEALHGLGIPTTRALCITGSPAAVQRETLETAAVVTRVAPSFIRFGHFEHFSASGQHAELQQLADYVIARHYPACQDSAQPYAALLAAVTERTAQLLAAWQAVGFCHGVMNTDNMSILGLTLDYGPFQFLDAYDPAHICNHSDTQGRYAYQAQPNMAHWNLFCLGQALLPLLDNTEQALAALAPYPEIFQQALTTRLRSKLGLPQAQAGDGELIQSSLKLLAAQRVDYTVFWRRLGTYIQQQLQPDAHSPALQALEKLFQNPAPLQAWLLCYLEQTRHINKGLQADLMQKSNPKFVLRNHLCEQTIRQATATPQDAPAQLQQLLTVLQSPFDEHPEHEDWADLPPAWAASIQISCSS